MKFTRSKFACAMLMVAAWQSNAMAGDTLLIHGHIYTGNPKGEWATALAVNGTHIEAVGSDAEVLKHRGSHAKIIDLHGQTVIPGMCCKAIKLGNARVFPVTTL